MDTITKILSSSDSIQGHAILTYIDVTVALTEDTLDTFINEILDNYPILKKDIVNNGTDVYLHNSHNFNKINHVKIIQESYDNFDKYINIFINQPFKHSPNWEFHYLTDSKLNKHRVYFKINHVYADGYKIIDMLTKPLKIPTISYGFKRYTNDLWNTLYYIIIGTLILIFTNIKIIFDINSASPQELSEIKETEYIKCKPFSLQSIKEVCRKYRITVNDFLYSLMIKTDYLYHFKKRQLIICCPISIQDDNIPNRIAPIFSKITNNLENNILFRHIHSLFNNYKYSIYIPIFAFFFNSVLNFFPLSFIMFFADYTSKRCDYIFTNIKGPVHNTLEDIHFLTIPKNNIIVFNIISSNDNVNLICSFNKGTIENKDRYEENIYKAYQNLTQT
jgi:hypothetical protein